MCWNRIWIIHKFADCYNHKTPPSSCSRSLKWSIVIPQTTSPSASGKCEPSSRSWCDRLFNCLIQIRCHRRAEATRWHLLIICPALVHTSVHPIQGYDCLLVPSVSPPIHSHLLSVSMSVIRTHFHTRILLQWHSHTPTYFNFNLNITFHLCSPFILPLHVSVSMQPLITHLSCSTAPFPPSGLNVRIILCDTVINAIWLQTYN